MPKLSEKALADWEKSRDLNAELEQSLADIRAGNVRRYTLHRPSAQATSSPNNNPSFR